MHVPRAQALLFRRCCRLALLIALCAQTHVAFGQQFPGGGIGSVSMDEVRARLAAVGERPKDAQAWFDLGTAYNRVGDAGEARKAFQKALKLRSGYVLARVGLAYTYFFEKNYAEAEKEAKKAADQEIESGRHTAHDVLRVIRLQRYRETAARVLARAERELANRPDAAEWHLLKAQSLIALTVGEQRISPDLTLPPYSPSPGVMRPDGVAREAFRAKLTEAAASLEKYFALKPPGGGDDSYLRGQLEALRFHTRDEDAAGADRSFSQSRVTSKALITDKPEPGFTKKARESGLSGLIRLRAVLAADGTVKHLLVLVPLGHGLTESALKAARAIKFRPAVVNGRPVSQFVILEYNFEVY